MDRSFKLFTVLALMITCNFLSTVSGASLFGINFEAPKNVIRKGVEKIPQILDRIPYVNQKSSENWAIPPLFPGRQQQLNGNTYNPTFNTNQFAPQQGPNFINEITTRKDHDDVYHDQVRVIPKNQESSIENWAMPPLFPERQQQLNGNTYNPTFNTNQFVPRQGPNFINEITTRKDHDDVYHDQLPVITKNQEPSIDKEDSGPSLSKNDEKYFAEEVNSVTETLTEYDTDYSYTTTADGEWTTIDELLNRVANPAVVASILG